MPIITVQETKDLLGIENTYSTDEAVTLASLEFKRLSGKSTAIYIWRVSADTNHSTKTTDYSTKQYKTTVDVVGYTKFARISDTSSISTGSTVYVSYYYNNEYDKKIANLIYKVQLDICNYCNNYFQDKNTFNESGNIRIMGKTSHTSTPDTYAIIDLDKRFTTAGFLPNQDITIEGSKRNEGIYYITNRQSSKLTLSTLYNINLQNEDTTYYAGNVIKVSRIKWPEELKITAAKMIWQQIDKIKSNNIQSKSLGPSAITYRPISAGGYSQDIIASLDKYKMTGMV